MAVTGHDLGTDPGHVLFFLDSWLIHLAAENKAQKTQRLYADSVRKLADYLDEHDRPTDLDAIRRRDVSAFLASLHDDGYAPASVSAWYRALYQFFRWAEDEGEIERSPMDRMKPPKVPAKPVPIIEEDALVKLFATCAGTSFEDRRDDALMRIMLDTGARLAEVTNLKWSPDPEHSDVDRTTGTLRVTRKGGHVETIWLGTKTLRALDRYLRVRPRHRAAGSSALWLGKRGPMTVTGVARVIKRRADEAGIGHVNPHRFRHTFGHLMKSAGVRDEDIMRLGGWRDPAMLRRYAASAADARARESHRKHAPGDLF